MKLELKTDNPTLLTCFGAALGMIVYLCIRAHWFWPSAFFCTFAGLFFLCFQDDRNAHRTLIFAMAVSAFLIICGWFQAQGLPDVRHFPLLRETTGLGGKSFYSTILILIAVPFFMTWIDKGTLTRDYPTLHAYTWERPFIYLGGWLFVLVLWMVLALWMFLFKAINISVFLTAFTKPWFIACSIGAGYALGVTMLQGKKSIVAATAHLASSLCSLLAPILALFSVLFLVMLPLSGIKIILNTGHTSELLALLTILAVTFINAIIRDFEVAPSRVLQVSAKVLAIVLPFVVVLAGTALYIRIAHYGLTPRRIDAAVLLSFALLYAVTYMAGVLKNWKGDWAGALRRVNINNAFVVLAVSAIMLTPLINLQKISVAQQKRAYFSGDITVDDLDLGAMKFNYGDAGKAAYEDIRAAMPGRADQEALTAKFATADKANSYYDIKRASKDAAKSKPLTDADIANAYDVFPKGAALPAGLGQVLSANIWRLEACQKAATSTRKDQKRCMLVLVDVQGDSAPEVLSIGVGSYLDAELFVRGADGAWSTANVIALKNPGMKPEQQSDAVRQGAASGTYKTAPSDYKSLNINGVIFNFTPRDY